MIDNPFPEDFRGRWYGRGRDWEDGAEAGRQDALKEVGERLRQDSFHGQVKGCPLCEFIKILCEGRMP